LFSFKRLVSQDIEVEQVFICEEHGISNKSLQEVDTCFFPTSQKLVTCSVWSFDSCDELSLFLSFFVNTVIREACCSNNSSWDTSSVSLFNFSSPCVDLRTSSKWLCSSHEFFRNELSSSYKNLSFILHLNFYQISILPPLLCAENCCIIADKIHYKIEASLIQFSWNSCNNLYHKYRVCIPNFKPIQIDLITQTWLRSQLT
jgi:hypothetical protein